LAVSNEFDFMCMANLISMCWMIFLSGLNLYWFRKLQYEQLSKLIRLSESKTILTKALRGEYQIDQLNKYHFSQITNFIYWYL